MTELVDTHCHLDMPELKSNLPDVLSRAKEAGVKKIITIGCDDESSREAIRIARENEGVYATVGLHPHDAKEFSNELFETLLNLAREPEVVAIGEIGLDYHYEHSPRSVQQEVFERLLGLARQVDLPVVVHSREARADTLRILRSSGVNRGVMHCFSGDLQMAEEAMAMGFYISIAGPVTFKNARKLQTLASIIPDEYLLIETDAPYLSPVPMRGKRNEPSYLIYTAETIAKLRGVSIEDIARITTLNANRLFGIGQVPRDGTIAYKIRDSLYLNITNRCTNACSFCVRFHTDYVKGHNLRLSREPDIEELKDAIGDPKAYREVVFCGYGEPLIRLDLVKTLAGWIKERGGRVRVNTNGHANLIHGRNILPELAGLVDSLSISLDAPDEETYNRLCRPLIKGAFQGVIEFIKEAKRFIPEVTVTVVDVNGVDIDRCKEIASELGVKFRLRKFNAVG